MLVAPRVSLGAAAVVAPRLIAKLCVVVPTVAFSIAVCAVATAATVAVKLVVVVPAATVTEAGTVTTEELLDRLTNWPPVGAAAFSAMVQLSVPEPVLEALAQARLSTAVLDDSAPDVALALRAEYAHAVRFARIKPETSIRSRFLILKSEQKPERYIRAFVRAEEQFRMYEATKKLRALPPEKKEVDLFNISYS
jgi:hypothetical protein